MSNFRYNPLTGQFVPETITDEQHTIAFLPEINAYAIRLNNGVQLTNPRSVTVVEDGTGIPFTEQTARTAPAAGEFWVDYEATGFYGSGLIVCNGADDGKVVNVSYKSLGRMVTEEQVADLVDDEFSARLAAPIVFGSSVTAPEFIGDLTGDVTGDLTGNVTGDVVGNLSGSVAIPASGTLTHGGTTVIDSSGNLRLPVPFDNLGSGSGTKSFSSSGTWLVFVSAEGVGLVMIGGAARWGGTSSNMSGTGINIVTGSNVTITTTNSAIVLACYAIKVG